MKVVSMLDVTPHGVIYCGRTYYLLPLRVEKRRACPEYEGSTFHLNVCDTPPHVPEDSNLTETDCCVVHRRYAVDRSHVGLRLKTFDKCPLLHAIYFITGYFQLFYEDLNA